MIGSLFLAISGSTVLNMAYDRDIDSVMKRTCWRPLPSGQVSVREAVLLGSILSALGVGWALALAPLYGAVVFAGLFFDAVVYTAWLKRRTPYAILIGGLAGGMPVLAGRVLAIGYIDAVGVMLALGVLLWIPTHIMTFSMRHFDDYRAAGIPTFPGALWFLRHAGGDRDLQPGGRAGDGRRGGDHRRADGPDVAAGRCSASVCWRWRSWAWRAPRRERALRSSSTRPCICWARC